MDYFNRKHIYYKQFEKLINELIRHLDQFDILHIVGLEPNEHIIQNFITHIMFLKQMMQNELNKFTRYLQTLADIYTVPERAIAYEQAQKHFQPNEPLLFQFQQQLLNELQQELKEIEKIEQLFLENKINESETEIDEDIENQLDDEEEDDDEENHDTDEE